VGLPLNFIGEELIGVGIVGLAEYLAAGRTEINDALVVEASTQCNHGLCAFCYNSCTSYGGVDMTPETARDIANTLIAHNVRPKKIWLSGGEPTMNSNLVEIVFELARVSDCIGLMTNGFSLAEEETYADELAWMPPLKEVAITLHSAHASTHNKLVMPSDASDEEIENCKAFTKVSRAFTNMFRAREEEGRDDLTIAVNVMMSQMRTLLAIFIAIRAWGGTIDKIILQGLRRAAGRATSIPDEHRLIDCLLPNKNMVQDYLDDAEELVESGYIKEAVLFGPIPKKIVEALDLLNHPMYAPAAMPTIDPRGRLRPDMVY